jgi:hypothetical protein
MYNAIMIRTQIYIPQETHKKLIRLAKKETKPMAELIRNFIDKGLENTKQKDKSGKLTLTRIANLKFTSSESNLSGNIDHYLYGSQKHGD